MGRGLGFVLSIAEKALSVANLDAGGPVGQKVHANFHRDTG